MRLSSCSVLFVCLLVTVGCTGAAEQKLALRKSNLTILGTGYRQFIDQHGSGPADLEAFSGFLLEQSPTDESTTAAVTSFREGDIVVIWGGALEQSDDDQYIGFEASVPASGGYLVTGSGSVQLVTAKRFAEMSAIPTP